MNPTPWLSYRLSLTVAIPLLVAATSGAVALNGLTTMRASTGRLASSLFEQVVDQTAEQVRSHVGEAAPTVDVLAAQLGDAAQVPASDDLARLLLRVLEANPGFEWVTFGGSDGTSTGATRRGGHVVINRSGTRAGRTYLDEDTVNADGSWTPLRHQDEFGYDPRTRPFYSRAVAAHGRVWLGPYIFYDESVPGITCAKPVYAADGSLRGVVTADFDLNILSTFVATLHPSEHARVFVYTDSGEIIAHPTVRVALTGANGKEGKLLTKDDVADPATRVYFDELAHPAEASPRAPRQIFEANGEPYYTATRSVQVSEGLAWKVGAIAPAADFLGDVERTVRISLLVSAGAVLIAVLLGAIFARRISAPLLSLAAEMDAVGRFDLDDRPLAGSAFKEIALMNRALTTMKGGLGSFALYVPRDLVRKVLASGVRAGLGGETKQMTVFFSDLAGFTTLSETLRPQELVELLGGYFDEMAQVIAARRGTIDKFIGDAIMAFWNAPESEADHAALACEAALACQARLDAMKQQDPKLAKLSARIGVATGEALVGNIGSHKRMNYTVMGDTVNLASRLESLSKAYGTRILVSEGTRRAVQGRVLLRAIDVVAVKGKKQGVRIYEPLALVKDGNAEAQALAERSEKALDAYLARRFAEAQALYEEILRLIPGDRAAQALHERCAVLIATPPDVEWSGVHEMHEK